MSAMNIPNILSAIRIVLVPVFIVVFFSGAENANIYAAGVFVLASSTDALDGYIARRFGMITKLGRVLDPFADKLMTASVLGCIAVKGIVSVWIVAVFMAKEIVMGLGALLMYRKVDDVIPSSLLGKASTVLFFLVCLILMVFPQIPVKAAGIMASSALCLTLVSLAVYAYRFFCLISKNGKKEIK